MLWGMKTRRNPLGFMGTGGLFERNGWWHIQFRDPQTKKNMQIKVSQKKADAKVRLALLMIGVYERRIEKLHELVSKARPNGLLPEDSSYRSSGICTEYVFDATNKGHREYNARVEAERAKREKVVNEPDKKTTGQGALPPARRSKRNAGHEPTDTSQLAGGGMRAALVPVRGSSAIRRTKTDRVGHVPGGSAACQ
jgi:hypothetical protein